MEQCDGSWPLSVSSYVAFVSACVCCVGLCVYCVSGNFVLLSVTVATGGRHVSPAVPDYLPRPVHHTTLRCQNCLLHPNHTTHLHLALHSLTPVFWGRSRSTVNPTLEEQIGTGAFLPYVETCHYPLESTTAPKLSASAR